MVLEESSQLQVGGRVGATDGGRALGGGGGSGQGGTLDKEGEVVLLLLLLLVGSRIRLLETSFWVQKGT